MSHSGPLIKNLSCILIAANLLIGAALAESPSFANAPFKVILEPTKEHDFRPDPAHTQDGKIVYSLIGHVFSASEGEIKPASGATPRSDALETFSEVLSAYAVRDIEKVRALYTPDSSSFFASILAEPEGKERWLKMAGRGSEATALMAFEHKGQGPVCTRAADWLRDAAGVRESGRSVALQSKDRWQ